MPIAQTELLFRLIKSLSKSEKRHFRLFVKRLASNEDVLFIRLFDIMDKAQEVNDEKFQDKLDLGSKGQYSNLKRHLYSQIIKSLRLLYISRDESISIREQMDYAAILYRKGLYHQSLHILDRIAPLAKAKHKTLLQLQILELAKKIESRHITRSRKRKHKIEQLIHDSATIRKIVTRTSALSDLSLNIQGYYIKYGFARNTRDISIYREYFKSHGDRFDESDASFYEYILWHQSLVWLEYMCLNFQDSLRSALCWAKKFNEEKSMIDLDPDLYMRGLHYILTNAFYTNDKDTFRQWMAQYDNFRHNLAKEFSESSSVIDFVYYYNAKLNEIMLMNNYKEFEDISTDICIQLERYKNKLDPHRVTMFQYKFAMIEIYLGQPDRALDHLNDILGNSNGHLRSDMLCYSRLLHLMCHYSLNNFNLVGTLLPSVGASFAAHGHNNKLQENILAFLKKGIKAMNFGMKDEISEILLLIEACGQDTFEKLPLIYFDFENWFRALKNNSSISEVRAQSEIF